MTEIEKLYDNAGVEKEVIPCPAKYYGYSCTKNNWDDADCSCDIEGYPPFTAEKQLELYRWLLKKENVDYLCYWYNEIKEVWIFRVYLLTEFSSENPIIYEGSNKEFDEALANLINDYWNDLTEQEQQQIKEILQ